MQYESYDIRIFTSSLRFEFWSEGPKGRIKKQVAFKAIEDMPGVFNLGFGDITETDGINDTVITGNGDSQKVLATVALPVYKFFEKYPSNFVFAIGSNKVRTRLYRIGISNNLEKILHDFELFGFIDGNWEPYKKERNYDAFLIKKKG